MGCFDQRIYDPDRKSLGRGIDSLQPVGRRPTPNWLQIQLNRLEKPLRFEARLAAHWDFKR